MISDPLFFPSGNDSAALLASVIGTALPGDPVPVVNIAANRSVRKGQGIQLTISHSESKENPGRITDRAAIRLETTKVDSVTGAPVTAQATLTISFPRGGQFADDEVQNLAKQLACGIILSQDDTAHVTSADLVKRIINGEM